ncbi:hypothetical protein CFP56_018768 [Quercus suber]|uniref:Uncharacterized protein n=1 Tax=Quercus suber TaxID=58331 RepID=A0AAW0KK83_QUESU
MLNGIVDHNAYPRGYMPMRLRSSFSWVRFWLGGEPDSSILMQKEAYLYHSVIFQLLTSWRLRTRANCSEKKIFIPAVQGFDHLVLGSSPRLGVQSEAREEPLQMHKRHFVELAFLSIVKVGKFKSQGPLTCEQ